MEVYEIIKPIGSGSFGQVYQARHKLEDKIYVIKKIKTRDMQPKDREATEQEVRLLQKLRHSNIVSYKDSYMDQDHFLNIVMVHCEGGDMYNNIRNCKGKNFPETQVLDWFAQMALALYYLHDKKILHRDLKTQNIFLKHGRVRLGDFGIAKVLDSTRDFASTCIGTPFYMSPELFRYKPYSYKSDVWALGCVMYEICNLRHAFDAQSYQGLAVKIIKGSYPPITPTYSKQLRDLIAKMLNLNPKERPTIFDVLNKPILKRRVVHYMAEIFSGQYPEARMPNDVDDIYVDSLKDQAENLNIMGYIQEEIAKRNNPEKPIRDYEEELNDNEVNKKEIGGLKVIKEEVKENKKALKQAFEEKENLEKELEKLERKEMLHKKMLPKDKEKNLKNRNYSQERIKKLGVGKLEERNVDEISSNREPKKLREEIKSKIRKAHSKDTKYGGVKTEASVDSKGDDKLPKLNQKEDKAPKKSQFNKDNKDQKDQFSQLLEEEEEKYKDKPKINIRKHSMENPHSMEEIPDAEEDLTDYDQARKNKKKLVLGEKERKRKEEEERKMKQLNDIRKDNFESRRMANEKRNAQYRPSHDMVNALNFGDNRDVEKKAAQYNSTSSGFATINDRDDNLISAKENGKAVHDKKFQLEEDYGMNDEVSDDDEEDHKAIHGKNEEEEEHEENIGNIQDRIQEYKERLQEKSIVIDELKKTLKRTINLERTLVNKNVKSIQKVDVDLKASPNGDESDEYSDPFELDDIGEDDDSAEEITTAPESEVQEKKSYPQQYYKFQDRIKLLKYRCEAGIGNSLYEKAYKYLNEKTNSGNQEETRRHLIEILGEENIGFWHLIDQILLFEGYTKKILEVN